MRLLCVGGCGEVEVPAGTEETCQTCGGVAYEPTAGSCCATPEILRDDKGADDGQSPSWICGNCGERTTW